jgi:cytochrome c biogenesis protein CcmG/thiol:disulfide interchange protein DsbE
MSQTINTASTSPLSTVRKRWKTLLPLAVFTLLAVLLGVGLTMDPRKIPSPLIGKPVPDFQLPAVQGRSLGFSDEDLRVEASLVNVFASWCTACRIEHPLLMELSREGTVPIHGLNYKDAPEDAAAWLKTFGDPYTRTGADLEGKVGIDWGVYGVPETFLVDANGQIAYKQIGPITREIWETELLPRILALREAPSK